MKKTLLISTALITALLVSCGHNKLPPEAPPQKLTSLEGTTWKGVWKDGNLEIFDEMVFTPSTATFTATFDAWPPGSGTSTNSFSGRYVFDADKQEFVMPNDAVQPYPEAVEEFGGIPDLTGNIKDGIMTFNVWESLDEYRTVKLKKQ